MREIEEFWQVCSIPLGTSPDVAGEELKVHYDRCVDARGAQDIRKMIQGRHPRRFLFVRKVRLVSEWTFERLPG